MLQQCFIRLSRFDLGSPSLSKTSAAALAATQGGLKPTFPGTVFNPAGPRRVRLAASPKVGGGFDFLFRSQTGGSGG